MSVATGTEYGEQGELLRIACIFVGDEGRLTYDAEIPIDYQSDRRGCPAHFDEDYEGETGSALAELNSSMLYRGIADKNKDAFVAGVFFVLSSQSSA